MHCPETVAKMHLSHMHIKLYPKLISWIKHSIVKGFDGFLLRGLL